MNRSMTRGSWAALAGVGALSMAVGTALGGDGRTALVALNSEDDASFLMRGEVVVDVDLVQVNSTADRALLTSGSTAILGPNVNVVGGSAIRGLPYTGLLSEGAAEMADPFADAVSFDVATMRDRGSIETYESGWSVGAPGYYSGGLKVASSSTLILMPGVYVLDGVGLQQMGESVLIADGVTFVIVGDGQVDVAGGAQFLATPPTSGPLRGVSIFQEPSNTNTVQLAGGGDLRVGGAIYAPGATVDITGEASISTMGVSVGELVVADKIELSGNGVIRFGSGEFRRPYMAAKVDFD